MDGKTFFSAVAYFSIGGLITYPVSLEVEQRCNRPVEIGEFVSVVATWPAFLAAAIFYHDKDSKFRCGRPKSELAKEQQG